MAMYLLVATVVIFACIFLSKVSAKIGMPALLAFILLGMFFGSDGVVKIHFDNYEIAEQICSVALVFIMFYGGFGTSWKAARPVAVRSLLMASLGVLLTAAGTGLFCRFVLGLDFWESCLIGSVISSTDAASVFSILRSRKLSLRYNTASLLEVESGSNDPFSYMLTVLCLTAMKGSVGAGSVAYMLFAQVVYGLVLGAAVAAAALYILRRIHFAAEGFEMIFVFGVALLAYAAPTLIGGNGYLSVYIAGIILGNGHFRDKKKLVHFFDGVTGMVQMLIFFLLGLLAFPSRLPQVAGTALLIALFLTFVVRPLAVFSVLAPFGSKLGQMLVVSWAGLRGASSIVFAISVVMSADVGSDIFHMVFFIVLFSILLQGSLFPAVSRLLNMIDESGDVMKTFNDYSEEVPVRFIQFTVPQNHGWCGNRLSDIQLPPQTLIVMVKRGDKSIAPNGSTVVQPQDKLVMTAAMPEVEDGIALTEIILDEKSAYTGKLLSQIPREEGMLVIMIQRKGEVIIPAGDTLLMEEDVLVLGRTDI